MEQILSTERRMRVLTVGASALCGLYLLVAFVAEPARSFATPSTSSDNDNKVSATVTTAISLACTDDNSDGNSNAANLSLGSLAAAGGDTGAYSASKSYRCIVISGDSGGYTLAWRVDTGSGGTSTGYMISQYEDKIAPFRYANSNDAQTTPQLWTVAAGVSAWGARLSSTSTSFSENPSARTITSTAWANDGGSEKWARVSSGSSVIFAGSTDETTDSGDNVDIGFRTAIGTTHYQQTGTYEALVDFTASTIN